MIRQPEYERLNWLTLKTLDQVFIARVRVGLGWALALRPFRFPA